MPDPTPSPAALAQARCPLCGQANGCALAAPGGNAADCWCMRTPVAPSALARLPADQRGLVCVCARCAQG